MKRTKVICSECGRAISARTNDPDELMPMNHSAAEEPEAVCPGCQVPGTAVPARSLGVSDGFGEDLRAGLGQHPNMSATGNPKKA